MTQGLEYWVWLGLAFESASGKTDEILRRFHTPELFYKENGARSISLTPTENTRLMNAKLHDAKRIVEDMDKKGIDILTPEDPRYPQRLRTLYARPCVLYVDGDLGDIDNELEISMVGTRHCSDYGIRAAAQIASELAAAGAVIVSGLATGIDTVCHKEAVKQDRRTIAVLGCGIDRTYPAQNTTLREIIARNGAVVSEYAPGSLPLSHHFPQRNRIISGLSVGTVVVEAGLRSGSLITANLALEQGRDVFAVPGDIFKPSYKGSFQLIKQGCIPVASGLDILEEYRYRFADTIRVETEKSPRLSTRLIKEKEPPEQIVLQGAQAQEQNLEGVSEIGVSILQPLATSPLRVEEIAGLLQKTIPEVLTALTELEIMGLVSACPGGKYQRSEQRF